MILFLYFQAQVHLLGNIIIWYSSTIGILIYSLLLVFYLLRRRRQCYDLDPDKWEQFILIGEVFFAGYLFHYLPYFFVERTLFLYHYLPALSFKILLLAAILEHCYVIFKDILGSKILVNIYLLLILLWLGCIIYVFKRFSVLSYGMTELSTEHISDLKWKETWDFIVHKSWTYIFNGFYLSFYIHIHLTKSNLFESLSLILYMYKLFYNGLTKVHPLFEQLFHLHNFILLYINFFI